MLRESIELVPSEYSLIRFLFQQRHRATTAVPHCWVFKPESARGPSVGSGQRQVEGSLHDGSQ